MKTLLKISEASVIAVHAMIYLFNLPKHSAGAKELSKKINISYNHLSKVLQRLAQKQLLSTTRGPQGGYYLTEKGKNCSLSDILSAIEGEMVYSDCFYYLDGCGRKKCELRNFLRTMNIAFGELLKKKLKDL